MIESVAESSRVALSGDKDMATQRTKVLLDQLREELERGAYRKNIRIETLRRRLKYDKDKGVSVDEDRMLRKHIMPEFDKMNLAEAEEHIPVYAKWLAENRKKSSAKKILRLLQKLIRIGDPSYSTPTGLKWKKPGNNFDASMILEMDEILKVIETRVYEPYKLPCKVALYTGMRMGNVFGLTKGNVDFKRKELRFTLNKVPKPMVVPISNKLSQVFKQVPWPLNDDTVLFPVPSTRQAVTLAVSRAFTRAGYEWFSFHNLRHTAACHLLEEGVDITVISALLGHSSIKVTMDFYARVKPKALRKAVNSFG
jgi:integrase